MATIEQTLTINDRVTNVLRRMSSGLERVSMSFRAVGSAAASMEAGTAAATAGVKNLGAVTTSVFTTMKSVVGAVVAPLAGLFALNWLTDIMNNATSATGGLGVQERKLDVILRQRVGTNNTYTESIKALIGEQQKLGVVGREAMTAGAQQLATFVTEKGTLEKLLPALNDIVAQKYGLNATTEDYVNVANMAGRALMGQEAALSRVGISFNAVQKDIIENGTEAEKAAAIYEVLRDNVGKMNEELGKTAGGRMKQAQFAIDEALRPVGAAIKGAVGSFKMPMLQLQLQVVQNLAPAIIEVMNTFKSFGKIASDAMNAVLPKLVAVGKAITTVYPYIRPLVLGAAGAFMAYKLALMGAWVWKQRLMIAEGLESAATAINTAVRFANLLLTEKQALALKVLTAQTLATQVAMIAATFATQGWTAGMIALDAAMAANPIGFIVLGVMALIGVFYLAIEAINHFAGTSISAVGLVIGYFYGLWAFWKNIFVFYFNIVQAAADFFADVWKDPLGAAWNFFATFWNNVLTLVGHAVNAIVDMIHQIPGMDKVLGKGGFDASNYYLSTKAITDSQATPWDNLGRYSNIGEEMQTGYSKGKGAVDYLADAFTPKIGKAIDDAFGPGLGNIEDSSKDTAGNTGAMKEAMEITEEDLKYLRDIAQQEAINKYTTASVKIDMGGVSNNISNGVDVDGMMMRLTNGLRESMANGGEKVRAMA